MMWQLNEPSMYNFSHITFLMSNMTYLNKDKISLQISLERNPSKYSYISLFDVNFENLIFGLHPLYVLNKYAKFHIN